MTRIQQADPDDSVHVTINARFAAQVSKAERLSLPKRKSASRKIDEDQEAGQNGTNEHRTLCEGLANQLGELLRDMDGEVHIRGRFVPAKPSIPKKTHTEAADTAGVAQGAWSDKSGSELAAPEPQASLPPNMKQAVTINMDYGLKVRAETAVLQTGHLAGGYRSQVKLIEAALEKELERLEAQFNDGVPFPPNTGEFRTGRPLGS